MALSNFSIPFGGLAPPLQSWGVTLSPPLHPAHQLATNTNNLLYAPADHQQQNDDVQPPPIGSDYYKNNPYAHPQLHQAQQHKQVYQFGTQVHSNNNNNNGRRKGGNTYLPPIPPPGARNTKFYQQQQLNYNHQQSQEPQQPAHTAYNTNVNKNEYHKSLSAETSSSPTSSSSSATETRTYDEDSYSRYPTISNSAMPKSSLLTTSSASTQRVEPQNQYYNTYNSNTDAGASYINSFKNVPENTKPQTQRQPATTYGAVPPSIDDNNYNDNNNNNYNNDKIDEQQEVEVEEEVDGENDNKNNNNENYPERPPGFTRVQGGQGSRTQVHAVLDYDVEEGEEEDYYDTEDHGELANKGKR